MEPENGSYCKDICDATMLDSGSEISMLRIPVVKKLGLTGVKTRVILSGINSTKTVDPVVS